MTSLAGRLTASGQSVTCGWIALCAITFASWRLAPEYTGHAAEPSRVIPVAVILLGFIKGRSVIRNFMEVHSAPRWFRMFTDAWLTVLWCAILLIYLT